MSHYELLCILSGKIAETDIAAVEKSIEELIKKNASAFHYAHHMDRKRLAYPIDHHHYGYYFVVEFDAEKSGTNAIDAELRLSADVLRHSLMTRAHIGAPPVVERKQSFDALPELGDVEQSSAHPPLVKPLKNDDAIVAPTSQPTVVVPTKDNEPKEKTEEPAHNESNDALLPPKEKKKQEKLSYEELDKKLDEIINNDLF